MKSRPATHRWSTFVLLILFAGMALGQRIVAPIDRPQFLQVEGVEAVIPYLGASYYYRPQFGNMAIRVLKATWHSGKGFRAGISGFDANFPLDIDDMGDPYGLCFAPVHVGYDIVLNAKKTAFFYGMVPSCYVEATLGAFPPYAKVAAACDIEYYGVGTGIEFGCVDWNQKPNYPSGTGVSRSFIPVLYASLKLRLLDAAFRLPVRR
jgi:hypothetical protein